MENETTIASSSEGEALSQAWNALGPLVAFAVKELGREAGLAVCNGLASGDLVPTWIPRPGLATCTIWKGSEIIYRFTAIDGSEREKMREAAAGLVSEVYEGTRSSELL